MTHGYFTFGHFAVGHLPGWHFPGAGGYLLFRGLGSANLIDYGVPVGFASLDAVDVQADPQLDHQPGATYTYALRTISDALVAETNTFLVCGVQVAPDGSSAWPMLPKPVALHARPIGADQVELQWRVVTGARHAAATQLEILADNGSGQWDEQHPLAAVDGQSAPAADYRVSVSIGGATRLAVRGRMGDVIGSVSEPVNVGSPSCPDRPAIL